jgi:thiopeptide-type bacteriocin biosynthesis protein
MAYVPIDRFLIRAPLLPAGDVFKDAGARLLRDRLGTMALAMASPRLAGQTQGERAARALGRYGRRAAFRATPSGLLAGVTVGALGNKTGGATGQPRAHLALSWGRVAALGRALIEDRAIRSQVFLRHAPSLLRGADRVRWLAFGAEMAEERQADLDARLARILDASQAWAPWAAVRAAARDEADHADHADNDNDDHLEHGAGASADSGAANDNDDEDELLLLLIDDGLLHHDLMPPLVGPPAADWMSARLATLQPAPPEAATLLRLRDALGREDLDGARAWLGLLPGAEDDDEDNDDNNKDTTATTIDPGVIATLVHQPTRPFTLARATVARAAGLAPLLFRLQQALTPPVAERLADGGVRQSLATARELFGDGCLDAAAWELGDYGVDPGAPPHADDAGRDQAADPRAGDGQIPASAAALMRLLVDEIAAARAQGRDEIALSPALLDQVLSPAIPPPTCELFLTPTTTRAGWLLGLHGPAGASWGRFGAALGAPMAQAVAALVDAERTARPSARRLDVAYAPTEALADLCAHPRARDGVLALSAWPARDAGTPPDTVTPAALSLVVTGDVDADVNMGVSAATGIALAVADAEVVPSPLARVRSVTAPPGLFRLLAGFSLCRQHAPWALSFGPLADLAFLPRVSIDGFVIAPASWRIPSGLDARGLRRWRQGADGAPPPPRFVQVGAEDELLPVDLDDPQAGRDLTGQPRAWEIWPPLPRAPARGSRSRRGRGPSTGVDRDGRRIEAVVALVDFPDETHALRLEARRHAIAQTGAVPPPRLAPAAPGWTTFCLYGVEERQDDVLLDAVAPTVRAALAAYEIDHWFFLRYADDRGRRPHLRLRVHTDADPRLHTDVQAGIDTFAARLDAGLRAARTSGAVATVETAAFYPERARFGGPEALAAALRIFQSDSELACALLYDERTQRPDLQRLDLQGPDLIDRLIAAFDSLATGLGLGRADRHQLARRRRDAEAAALAAVDEDEPRALDVDFRARSPRLRMALGTAPASSPAPSETDDLATVLTAHRDQVAAAVRDLSLAARCRLAPPLLHLSAVRLLGPDRDAEARAYLFWERTLEGLLRSPPRDDSNS